MTPPLRTVEQRKRTLRTPEERDRSAKRMKKETIPKNSSDKVEKGGKKLQKQGNQMDVKKINESLKLQLDELKLEIDNEQKNRKKLDLELDALKLQCRNVQKVNESYKKQLDELTLEIDNEQKDRKKLDLELETLKLLYRSVQVENESLTVENESLKVEKQTQNELVCTLRGQLHGCKTQNEIFEKERKRLKNELVAFKLQHQLMENEKEKLQKTTGCSITTSLECTATCSSVAAKTPLSLTGLEASSSTGLNQESNPSSTWRKVSNLKEYNDSEDKLKQFLAKQRKLTSYINGIVFEDEVEPFIQKSMIIIFRKDFFLKCTSYYHEEHKGCLKDSKILQCLMKSMESKLGEKVSTIDLKTTIKNHIKKFKADVKRNPILWVETEN